MGAEWLISPWDFISVHQFTLLLLPGVFCLELTLLLSVYNVLVLIVCTSDLLKHHNIDHKGRNHDHQQAGITKKTMFIKELIKGEIPVIMITLIATKELIRMAEITSVA